MDASKITCSNKTYTITCLSYDMNLFIEEIKNKFNHSFYYEKGDFKTCFSFPFSLSLQQYQQLFQVCDAYHINVLGFHHKEEKRSMSLLQSCFYPGEKYELFEDTVYVGDIEEDIHISTGCHLYVVGQVRGKVDLLYQDLELSASSFLQAKVRIFDTTFQNVTKLSPCKVYYEEEEMKVN